MWDKFSAAEETLKADFVGNVDNASQMYKGEFVS